MIQSQQQASLFQRFARASNVEGIMGTGLGLYLCRELVERHDGHIWLESVEGQGSTFFFALPTSSERKTTPAEGSQYGTKANNTNTTGDDSGQHTHAGSSGGE